MSEVMRIVEPGKKTSSCRLSGQNQPIPHYTDITRMILSVEKLDYLGTH